MPLALSAVASIAFAAALSPSHLGVATVGGPIDDLVAACPRVVVAARPLAGAAAAAVLHPYVAQCPGGAGVLELPPIAGLAPVFTDAATAAFAGTSDARTYWAQARPLAVAGGADAARLLGPSNFATTPDWRDATAPGAVSLAYATAFWAELAGQVAADPDHRWHLVLPAPLASSVAQAAPFCPLARAAAARDPAAGWSWAARSPGLATDVAAEAESTFGYRAVRQACTLAGMPVLLQVTSVAGWAAASTQALAAWLPFLDAEVAKDPEVTAMGGAALYAAGAAGPEDLSPVAAQLARHLAAPTPAPTPTPTPSQGGVAPPPVGATPGGTLGPGGGGGSGCGNAGGALALLGLAPFLSRLRRSGPARSR